MSSEIPSSPAAAFGRNHAAEYDERFARLAPLKEALHLLMIAALRGLPGDARVLCVGAGTGAEILTLAEAFPGWRFVAVDPSGPMLAVARDKAAAQGIAERCEFHEGYLDSLPAGESFDAATSILVSQFVMDRGDRVGFFKSIASRLRPGAPLISADLTGHADPAVFERELSLWCDLMLSTGQTPEQIGNLREAYGTHVALLPEDEVASIIVQGGFTAPLPFLQAGLIRAWLASRA